MVCLWFQQTERSRDARGAEERGQHPHGLVDWDDARRAENYRVTITDLATPPNELASEIAEESEHTFSGLVAGTDIRVTVTARNTKGGESGASAPGTVP